MAQQGSGPPRYIPAPSPGTRDPGRSSADPAETGDELPPWVVPDPVRPPRRHQSSPSQDRAERRARRLLPGRAQATRARRARRRLHVWGAVAGGAAVIAVAIYLLLPGSRIAPAGANGFVTTYLPGELRSVPDMCTSVSAATIGDYLPGTPTRAALSGLTGNSGNQCDWTLDHKPVYRLLQVIAQAYAPSGLASGNGSATAAAKDAYAQALQGERHPVRATHLPPARIATLRGLGTVAFSAVQVIRAGGDTTDRVTVIARFRNVLVTVEFSGLQHARRGGYGPVSPSQLAAGAAAAARDAMAKIG